MLFALQGDAITSRPLDVVRIALPLLIYFALMWAGSYALGRAVGLGDERTTTLAFTAAGNNVELAIAVAIATWGATSGQALAGVVGRSSTYRSWSPSSTSPSGCDAASPRPARCPRRPAMADDRIDDRPEVLLVCGHNAGRSQMPAALLDHDAQGTVHVRSAGSTPANEINPAVREVMGELGLDLSREFPRPLTTDVVDAADVVITMGCGDACPVFPGKRYLDWELTDPAGKGADDVRPDPRRHRPWGPGRVRRAHGRRTTPAGVVRDRTLIRRRDRSVECRRARAARGRWPERSLPPLHVDQDRRGDPVPRGHVGELRTRDALAGGRSDCCDEGRIVPVEVGEPVEEGARLRPGVGVAARAEQVVGLAHRP